MPKLDAGQLAALGAPARGGSPQIESWLRQLLRRGVLDLSAGPTELRGPESVVTTLGALKTACHVASETVKQGLRTLEMDHWIAFVDGAHTRLLGPPRFQINVTKENVWGSIGGAIEIALADELDPMESVDMEALRQPGNLECRRHALRAAPVTLQWNASLQFAGHQRSPLKPNTHLTLAAGTVVRQNGRTAVLSKDCPAHFNGGRDILVDRNTPARFESADDDALAKGARAQLERTSLIRLADGRTCFARVDSHLQTADGQRVDWSSDNHWLTRFRPDASLLLLRRAIVAELRHVVAEDCAGVNPVPSDSWRVALGLHECILDASAHATDGQADAATAAWLDFLNRLRESDSMRRRVESEFGVTVARADVRFSPAAIASTYDRELLRTIASDPRCNSEVLALGSRLPCWTQVGAYYHGLDPWPWEITRELYFTYVDMRFRQTR